MNVCVVGSGGREHALATVLRRHHEVVVTPGNPGIPGSVSTPATEIDADLYVIGPEAPLVAGLADELRAAGKLVFGPGADGARLEGSKAWMKDVLVAAGVPTARHGTFTEAEPAFAFLDTLDGLYVVKTDGLAAGKGVVVTTSLEEARDAVRDYLSGDAFGDAGRTLVIEEGLTGPEVSVLAICDGTNAVALAPAQDFKRVGDGDAGPNTGGMGAYSPVPVADQSVIDAVMNDGVLPTLAYLRSIGIDYRGPKMLEYNVRFGDPETQVVLPRLTSDLGELLASAAAGQLGSAPTFDDGAAVTVVCAAEGYPRDIRSGDVINGLDDAQTVAGATVFCAGVGANEQGQLVTSGGRVLTVTGQGATIAEARQTAYEAVGKISWPGLHHRNDIASAAAATTNGGSR